MARFDRSLVGIRRWLAMALVAVAFVAAGATAGMMVSRQDADGQTAPAQTAGPSTGSEPDAAPPAQAPGLVAYTDQKLGFKVAYPPSWRRVDIPPDSLVLDAGGDNAVSIRRFSLESAIDASNLAQIRAVTDGILGAPQAKLTILQTEQIKVGDLLGIYYLYSFPFKEKQGVHAHYFLFNGRTMYTLVFQAGEATEFEKLAPTFDAVSASFQATGT